MITKPESIIKLEQTLKQPLECLDNANRWARASSYALDGEGNIITLNLRETGIQNFIITPDFKHLQKLDLSKNALTSVQFETALPNLELLDISYNKAKWAELILPEGFDRLKYLYAYKSQIENIVFKSDLSALNDIVLKENPLITPPKQIVEQGIDAIKSYVESIKEAKSRHLDLVPINEIKIILVGDGKAGKTSLLKKIKGLTFNENESQTHGVIIEKLLLNEYPLFKKYEILRGVTGRFWDFGGQEIMHASHQFFLSNRSIYILVIDSRNDEKKEEGLKQIEKFGGNSPAIVAINKIDGNANYDAEPNKLNSKFPFIGNRFHRISCKTDEGVEGFIKELADLIPQTEIFKTPFNPSWVAVKEQLESETEAKKYIDQKRFEAICNEKGVTDKTAQKTLLGYLDSLGIALHFEKLDLQNFYVLDPHWVTIGVYKIINSQVIDKGYFKENMLDYILNKEEVKNEEYDPAKDKKLTYSAPEQAYLIKIMQQFELLYEYAEGHYLVPDLLPKEPQTAFSVDDKDSEHIHFVITYDFLPPSVMSRFIIRMKNDIHNLNHLWRYGVELKNRKSKTVAIVKSDKAEKRIDICIAGDDKTKRDYFAVIHHAIWEINTSFDGLIVKEFMPIPDHPEILRSYEELKGLEKMGEDRLPIGELGKVYSVSKDFLDKISTKEERLREFDKKGNTYIFNDKTNFIQEQNGETIMEQNTPNTPKNDPIAIYSYLSAAIVLGGILLIALDALPTLKAVLFIVGLILLLTLVAFFQLKNDNQIKEETFVDVLTQILKKMPPLSFFGKKE